MGWTAATAGRGARRIIPDAVEREMWIPRLARLRDTGQPDTWDYQWVATLLRLDGVAVVPRRNLITNTGFGPDATHTRNPADPRAGRPTEAILPLTHPEDVRVDQIVDRQLLEGFYKRQKFARRLAERRSLRGRTRRTLGLIRRALSVTHRRIRARAEGAGVRL